MTARTIECLRCGRRDGSDRAVFVRLRDDGNQHQAVGLCGQCAPIMPLDAAAREIVGPGLADCMNRMVE